MTSAQQEVLDFLREFELSSRNYFIDKGVTVSELPTLLLEAQWQLLRNILQAKLGATPRQKNHRNIARRTFMLKKLPPSD